MELPPHCYEKTNSNRSWRRGVGKKKFEKTTIKLLYCQFHESQPSRWSWRRKLQSVFFILCCVYLRRFERFRENKNTFISIYFFFLKFEMLKDNISHFAGLWVDSSVCHKKKFLPQKPSQKWLMDFGSNTCDRRDSISKTQNNQSQLGSSMIIFAKKHIL